MPESDLQSSIVCSTSPPSQRSPRHSPKRSPRPSPRPSPRSSPHTTRRHASPRPSPRPSPRSSLDRSASTSPLDPSARHLSPRPSPRNKRRASPRNSPRNSVNSSSGHSRGSCQSNRSHRSHSDSSHSGHHRVRAGGPKKKRKKPDHTTMGNLQRSLTWTRTLSLRHNRRRHRHRNSDSRIESAPDEEDEDEKGVLPFTLVIGALFILAGIAATGAGYGLSASPYFVRILGPLFLAIGLFIIGLDRAMDCCQLGASGHPECDKSAVSASRNSTTSYGRRSRQPTPQPMDEGTTFQQSIDPNQMLVLPTTPLFDYPIPDSDDVDQAEASNQHHDVIETSVKPERPHPKNLDLHLCTAYTDNELEQCSVYNDLDGNHTDEEEAHGQPSPNFYVKV